MFWLSQTTCKKAMVEITNTIIQPNPMNIPAPIQKDRVPLGAAVPLESPLILRRARSR
jgi:hypothetical protein